MKSRSTIYSFSVNTYESDRSVNASTIYSHGLWRCEVAISSSKSLIDFSENRFEGSYDSVDDLNSSSSTSQTY